MGISIIKRLNKSSYAVIGILAIVLAWHVAAMLTHPLVVPSPLATLKALLQMAVEGEITSNLMISIKRQLSGLSLGVLTGTLLGVAGGISAGFYQLTRPLINTIQATPSVIFVVVAMVWFGVGTVQTVFVVALLVVPVMYINCAHAVRSIDPSFLEMAKVFCVPRWVQVKKIYLPGLLQGFLAGFALSAASSLRLVVFAEVMGAREGIGPAIALTRNYLETDKLFAWALVLIVLVVVVEAVILKPLESYRKKWQNGTEKS